MLGLLAVTKGRVWRLPAFSAAVTVCVFGFVCILNPQAPGSVGAVWGALALAWSVLFDRRKRSSRSDPDDVNWIVCYQIGSTSEAGAAAEHRDRSISQVPRVHLTNAVRPAGPVLCTRTPQLAPPGPRSRPPQFSAARSVRDETSGPPQDRPGADVERVTARGRS